jgi:hypothetical protein
VHHDDGDQRERSGDQGGLDRGGDGGGRERREVADEGSGRSRRWSTRTTRVPFRRRLIGRS